MILSEYKLRKSIRNILQEFFLAGKKQKSIVQGLLGSNVSGASGEDGEWDYLDDDYGYEGNLAIDDDNDDDSESDGE